MAIRALTAGFTDVVNRRSPEELGALFHEQGELAVTGLGETQGPEAIAALLGRFSFLVQILHSGVVELDGDLARARWHLSEFAVSDEERG